MTPSEKQEIIDAVIAAIKADENTNSLASLPVVDTLTGVNSLPAIKGVQMVSVPIGLLSAAADAAASTANTAASNAGNAAQLATNAANGFLSCVTSGGYDLPNNRFVFFNKNNSLLFYVDMSPFTKDANVENVTFANGNLTITFNQDANKSPIVVSLASIFNAANYYTKTDVDRIVTDATFIDYDEDEESLIFGTSEPVITTTSTTSSTTVPPASGLMTSNNNEGETSTLNDTLDEYLNT